MDRQYDVIVVGGGVVGCFIARALSRYRVSVLLLERESDVCSGASKANSAIVHAGYDAKPGSLKATLNVAGNRMYDQVCGDLGVLFDRCGTYVVAFTDEDLSSLDELYQRGLHNGVAGMSIISGAEMMRAEPLVNPQASGGIGGQREEARMKEQKTLICITCPMGCRLDVTVADGQVVAVEGQSCKRGLAYAHDEITAPRRVVTTTVRVEAGRHPLLPVYTDHPFPKGQIFALLEVLRRVAVRAPMQAGQVILANALDTGINILASRDMPPKG
jgi:CxxC motif-containing protein